MKKEIRFSAVLDNQEFDRSIKEMQQKLTSVYAASDRSATVFKTKLSAYGVGAGPAPTMADKARADRDELRQRQEMIRMIRQETREQEDLAKSLEKALKKKRELSELAKKDTEAKKELLRVEQEISKISSQTEAKRANVFNLASLAQRPGYAGYGGWAGIGQRGMEQFGMARAGGGGGFYSAGAGLGGMAAGAGDFFKFNPRAAVGGIFQATGGLMVGAAHLNRTLAAMPGQIVQSQGAAISGQAMPATDLMSGQFMTQMINRDSLNRAKRMAAEQVRRERASDELEIMGLGSVLSGSLTSGNLTGAGAVGLRLLGSRNLRNRFFAGVSDSAYQQYGADYAARQAELQQQAYEGFKAQNPLLQAVIPKYQQYAMENLPVQQALGLGDQQMMDRLTMNAQFGFTGDQTRRSMMGILAAGGGTGAAGNAGLSALSLQMQRRGMSNADQTIGQMAFLGGGDASFAKDATIRLLSQAFAKGLDSSEFREENKKFMEIQTSIIAASGASDIGGMQAVASDFSRILGTTTSDTGAVGTSLRQLRGAQQGYNLAQEQSTMGGPMQYIRLSGYMKEPALKGSSSADLAFIDQLSIADIRSGDKIKGYLQDTAKRNNVTEDEVKESLIRSKMPTATSIAQEALRDMGNFSDTSSEKFNTSLQRFISAQSATVGGVANLDREGQIAYAKFLQNVPMSKEEEAKAMQAMEAIRTSSATGQFGPAEFAGQKLQAGVAATEQMNMELFTKFRDNLDVSAEDVRKFGKEILAIVDDVKKKIQSGDFAGARAASERGVGELLGSQPKTGPGQQ